MENEDVELIKEAQKDASKFDELYKKYTSKVYNYFWYRVGHDREASEDLMQETFIRAFAHLKKYKITKYSYFTYLRRIAHNQLVNYYRKPKEISLYSVGDVPTEIIDHVERKSDAEALWRAVQQLPLKEKDAILLKYRKELPIKVIATISGDSENAVKLRLSRARKRLAKHPYLKDMAKFAGQKKSFTPPRYRLPQKKK